MDKDQLFASFKEKLLNRRYLQSAIDTLTWDQDVNMPPHAYILRANTISHLSALRHQFFISEDFAQNLYNLKNVFDQLDDDQKIIVQNVFNEFEKKKKLPKEFIKKLDHIKSESNNVWQEAKKKSDFRLVAPYLKKIVDYKREEASFIGYKSSPYDVFLQDYEEGASSQEIAKILDDLRIFLVDFLKKIKKSKKDYNYNLLKGNFSLDKQKKFTDQMAEKIGFNFNCGKISKSAHPYTLEINPPLDVRLTTRFDKKDLFYSLRGTLHELGHALYFQGLPIEHYGTPLADLASLGINESVAKIFENIIGKSKCFWRFFYPKLQEEFKEPFVDISFENFYQSLNVVKPNLIRIDSDELTYILHLIICFEIEKDLIEAKIEVKDLPEIWNTKIKEYLGLKVPYDSKGILQDIHWYIGGFGYLPLYGLANLYATQIYQQAKKDIPNLERSFSLGHFGEFKNWLTDNIFKHGKKYSASELLKRITSSEFNNQCYIQYIEEKYQDLY